jgi:hypothetical protein
MSEEASSGRFFTLLTNKQKSIEGKTLQLIFDAASVVQNKKFYMILSCGLHYKYATIVY